MPRTQEDGDVATSARSPRVLPVREFGYATIDTADVLCDGRLDVYTSIARKGYFSVEVATTGIRLRASSFIGVIPINDRLTLDVSPRVPLANMSRLIAVSGRGPTPLEHSSRQYESGGDLYPSLATIYATALRSQVAHIAHQGFLREYQRIDEMSSLPRGRVRLGETMRRAAAYGLDHRVAVTRFERAVDNAPNRCLVYAAWHLAQYAATLYESLPRRELHRIHADLNTVKQQFRGVRLDLSREFLKDRTVSGRQALPSLRSYYRPALELALAIIGRRAVLLEKSSGEIELPSLVINMSDVFEAYLREVLREGAAPLGLHVLDGNARPPLGAQHDLLHEGVAIEASPDIVIARRTSAGRIEPQVIVEVKYKPAKELPDRHDLNQTITYGLSCGVEHVMIVQPRAEHSKISASLHALGRIGDMTVWYYVFDLDGDVKKEEQAFVNAACSLVTAVQTGEAMAPAEQTDLTDSVA